MARVVNNNLTSGISGLVGKDLLFKTWKNGHTYIYKKPKKPKTQSPLQKENRTRFTMATAFAKLMMEDPEKKAQYWEAAKKLGLPNAYTAAITDYMRRPEITNVELSAATRDEGTEIKITARKMGFEIKEVEVVAVDDKGSVTGTGKAERVNRFDWKYRIGKTVGDLNGAKILVKVRDNVGNVREGRFGRV